MSAVAHLRRVAPAAVGDDEIAAMLEATGRDPARVRGALERWWAAQNQLRPQSETLGRRVCPVCRCELRRTGGEMRAAGATAATA